MRFSSNINFTLFGCWWYGARCSSLLSKQFVVSIWNSLMQTAWRTSNMALSATRWFIRRMWLSFQVCNYILKLLEEEYTYFKKKSESNSRDPTLKVTMHPSRCNLQGCSCSTNTQETFRGLWDKSFAWWVWLRVSVWCKKKKKLTPGPILKTCWSHSFLFN